MTEETKSCYIRQRRQITLRLWERQTKTGVHEIVLPDEADVRIGETMVTVRDANVIEVYPLHALQCVREENVVEEAANWPFELAMMYGFRRHLPIRRSSWPPGRQMRLDAESGEVKLQSMLSAADLLATDWEVRQA